ncbi:N/A [soil metagenome]
MHALAFVCTANLCRSVMAHSICVAELARRRWAVEVYSAGTMDLTGVPPAIPTWVTCCQNGTPPQKDASTFVRDLPHSLITRFFVMEETHSRVLVDDYDVPPSRVSLLGTFDPESQAAEIDDPINQGSVEFDRCYIRIRRCIRNYLDTTTEIP